LVGIGNIPGNTTFAASLHHSLTTNILETMIIGVPKEIKSNENRVALTPAGAMEFTRRGHSVMVQSTAGEGSGFDDKDYIDAGAKIMATADEVLHLFSLRIQ
jgi:alanine dehydrogenase